MKPCPRCRRTTCCLASITAFAQAQGWPEQLRRFVHAAGAECEHVARELRAARLEAYAS